MRRSLFFTLLALTPLFGLAQSDKPVQRKDSITVSGGIPKEQLALESQLNNIISQGDQLLRSGNATDAVKQYQYALALVQKQPLLAERERWVQGKLARGYIGANRPTDAIPIYSKLLDEKKEECGAKSAEVSNCADAEYELGAAKMHAADFSGALGLLRDADSKYAWAEKISSDSHEFAMIQLKNQGQVKLLISVALFRTGNAADAVTAVETAMSQLTRVRSDETITVGIRDDAAKSIHEAQTILSSLKSAR
jgi:tetratricopeptide (TPR) repeat protein